MRVLFLLRYFRNQASSRIRGFHVAEELKRRNITCNIIHGYNNNFFSIILGIIFHNTIYFQKRYSKKDIILNRIAKLAGKRTVFDIDDAPSGVNFNPEAEERVIQMVKNSSVVIVGSHKLRDFVRNFSDYVYLVPTSINIKYYNPNKGTKNRNYITLGWMGNGINYKEDLLMLIKPIEKIGKKYDIKLTIIGALGQKKIHQSFGKMKNVIVEIIDSIDWADSIAVPSAISDFDIGLYPLLDNEYNQYKCGFKALEYMAMEIPVVASPVGENTFIVENGTDGFLASSEREWEEKLFYLIENENNRKRMGKIGRNKIKQNYSLEVCANKLVNIFEKIEEK